MTSVLIAGCGYVGNALGCRLMDRAAHVWRLRRNTSALAPVINAIEADLTDAKSLVALPRHLDAVVYAAAAMTFGEAAYRQTYAEGLSNTLTALRRAGQRPRFVFVPSTSFYG